MNNNSEISKSQRKEHTRHLHQLATRYYASKDKPTLLDEYMQTMDYSEVLIVSRSERYKLDISMKKFFGNKVYKNINSLLLRSIRIHNKVIAGTYAPHDTFLVYMNANFCLFIDEVNDGFFKIGREIGQELRSKKVSAVDAMRVLFYLILRPIDKVVDIDHKNTRLRILMIHAIDLLVQGFWDSFGDKRYFNSEFGIDFNKIYFENNIELSSIKENIELYGVNESFVCTKHINYLGDLIINSGHLFDLSMDEKFNMIEDIISLMPLFFKRWNTSKTKKIIDICGNKYYLYFSFINANPSVCISPDEISEEQSVMSPYFFQWYQGSKCFKSLQVPLLKNQRVNAIEDIVLTKFHDLMVELFVQRKDPMVDQSEPYVEELVDNQFDMDVIDILADADDNDDIGKENKYRIPSLTLNALVKILEESFNCKSSGGKGSELKIWIQGGSGTIFSIGRHSKNNKVPPFLISNILNRLVINKEFFLDTLRERYRKVLGNY